MYNLIREIIISLFFRHKFQITFDILILGDEIEDEFYYFYDMFYPFGLSSTRSVYNEKEEIYFLRYNRENNEEKINYIKVKEDNEEKLYAGISTSLENVKKIKEMYDNEGIELIVEEKKVDSKEFISELSQYDILLKSSKTIDEISSVLSTILATYEESVLER